MKKLHSALLKWYHANSRDLPWRKNKDRYRVWLSEIMLQQTRVEAVLPYYERFLSHFPTIKDLANAPEEKVTNLWAGLGYYSRARNLHKAAKQIIAMGKFPETLEGLRGLAGVGEYTASAIASICFDVATPAIDGNLERVISRLLALKKNPKTEGKAEIRAFANGIVKHGNAGEINQAFMDLASSICLPKQPRCEECPIRRFCEADKLGVAVDLPVRPAKKEKVLLEARGVVVLHRDSLLLGKRPKGAWLAGMWDIPWWIGEEKREIPGTQFGVHHGSRTITHHKIRFEVEFLRGNAKSVTALKNTAEKFKWVKLQELTALNLPRPSEKALNEALRASGLFAESDR